MDEDITDEVRAKGKNKNPFRRFPWLHLVLFVLTIFSTLVAGMVQKGIDPLKQPGRIYEGIPFSATLIIILLAHELSHYFASKKHNTMATLPYFIPAPTLIGTFGAVIKMKSPILSRRALVDIGASGPISGFVVSVAACIIGLHFSHIIRGPHAAPPIELGDSMMFYLLTRLVVGSAAGGDIVLNPIAFAGWIGFFVTFLNLLPAGQLDGGHVAYAFLGPLHKMVSRALVFILAVLGIFFWKGWLVWAALLLIIGIKHPPVYHWEVPLEPSRRYIGLLVFLIFLLTFIPTPFKVSM
ncbi:MAG: site-2 protease family protein [Nitrospiraceae bacterium]|nr:site-2 protease family protein [Nitrospiraceae bacterium]